MLHILTAHHYIASETVVMCLSSLKPSHSGRVGADDSSEKGERGHLSVFEETAARAVGEACGESGMGVMGDEVIWGGDWSEVAARVGRTSGGISYLYKITSRSSPRMKHLIYCHIEEKQHKSNNRRCCRCSPLPMPQPSLPPRPLPPSLPSLPQTSTGAATTTT